MEKNTINRQILEKLNQRPIAFQPLYVEVTGSITAALLLSQLMYWFSTGRSKIYKTDAEIRAETHMSENEMRSAKNKIKKLNFLKISREGIPAKTYYEIDYDAYISHVYSLVKSTKLYELNSPNSSSEINETYNYTENTTKNTTEREEHSHEKVFGWKTEIKKHPLFGKFQKSKFNNLSDEEIDLVLDLMSTEDKFKHKKPTLNQTINWLSTESKIKIQKINKFENKNKKLISNLYIEIIASEYENRIEYENAIIEFKKKETEGYTVRIHEPTITTKRIWGETD